MKGQIDKFWNFHQKSPIAQIPAAKDLLTKMLTFNPKERIDINGFKAHEWMQGTILEPNGLIAEIRYGRMEAEKKRRQNVRKKQELFLMDARPRTIPGIKHVPPKMFPEDQVEGMLGEVYTYLGKWVDVIDSTITVTRSSNNLKGSDLYLLIGNAVESKKGDAVMDHERGIVKYLFVKSSVSESCEFALESVVTAQLLHAIEEQWNSTKH